jgi:hypothetical protein
MVICVKMSVESAHFVQDYKANTMPLRRAESPFVTILPKELMHFPSRCLHCAKDGMKRAVISIALNE